VIHAFLVFVLRPLVGADWDVVRTRIESECARLERYPEFAPLLVALRFLVSGEDHRHGWHQGFDPIAICRAMWRRAAYGAREGASTIEQQLVRSIMGRYERTIRRKLKEVALATLVSASFPKAVLPSVYLAIGYFGWRMNGYRQACDRLGLRPDLLTLDEAAALIARLKYPEPRITPHSRRLQIDRRRRHLIDLYRHHVIDGTYAHLHGQTILRRCISLGAAEPIPKF
jgi:membrane peptidoglycan carboxypeptidase